MSDRIILIWKITKSIQNISGLDIQVLQRIKTSLYKDLEQKGLIFEIYSNTLNDPPTNIELPANWSLYSN